MPGLYVKGAWIRRLISNLKASAGVAGTNEPLQDGGAGRRQLCFSLCLARSHWCIDACLLHCPTKACGCAESKQDIRIYHLALVPGVCNPESQGTATIRNTVLGGCHHQDTAQTADWNPSPVFLGKKIMYTWISSWESKSSNLLH